MTSSAKKSFGYGNPSCTQLKKAFIQSSAQHCLSTGVPLKTGVPLLTSSVFLNNKICKNAMRIDDTFLVHTNCFVIIKCINLQLK